VAGLLWDEGPQNGGTPIIDYQIDYDKSANDWVTLATGVQLTSYSTTVTLIPGNTYQFKVRSRNAVGFGPYSSITSILVA
jgi:hypothetical protein